MYCLQKGPADDDAWCVNAKAMLLDHIKNMPLPKSPLDDLIDQLGGPGCVAEMTGRRSRVVRYRLAKDTDGTLRYESREIVAGVSVSSASSGVDSLNIREVSEDCIVLGRVVHCRFLLGDWFCLH